MERTSSPSYPDRPLSAQDETHMLVTLEQGVYHRPVRDCSPLAESMILYDRDVDMSIAEADLSGVSSEGDMDPQALFYHPYEHERPSKDGAVAPYGGILARFQEGSGLFTHLPCPELPLRLEDPVTDEHVSHIRHSIETTANRSQLCTDGEEQMNLLKPTSMLPSSFQGPADLGNVNASNDIPWERSLQEIREKGSREERSSKTFSDAKDFLNLHRPREHLFSLESRMATAMKRSNEQLGNNLLDVNSKLAMERYLASTSAPFGSIDSVKGVDSFHSEHLEQIRTSVERFNWVSEHDACTNSTFREAGLGIPLRGQTVRGDPPPITLPIFRKSLNPNLNKPSYYEGVLSHRKAMGMEQDLSHLSHLNSTTDWTLQRHSHQSDVDITGCKQTWTVNDDDSLEQIPPESLEPASCSSYNVDMRPYMCSMMLGETEKEDIVQEDHASVYTCIECSIYFNKKEHLMEHMLQHTREQGSNLQEPPLSVLSQFSCSECGWSFGDSTTLEQHRKLHQESREKIIEEIQKLNDFSDEGREARLQCPKCVFGTNSSKVFVQHAKMHVKERKDQEVKSILDSTADEDQEVTALPSFQQFKPNEPHSAGTPPQGQSLSSIKSAITCILCGFPAPNETLLKQHMKFSHPSPSWSSESYAEHKGTPGTSREAYSLPKPRLYPETEFFCKKERLTPPPPLQPQPTQLPPPIQPPLPTPNSSPPPPPHASHTLNAIPIKSEPGLDVAEDQRSDTSDIPIRKSIHLTKFPTRKLLPFGSLQRKFGTSYPSSKGYVPNVALKIKKKILAPFKGHGIDNRRKHGAMLSTRHGWSTGKNSEGLGGGFSFRLKTGFLPTLKKLSKTVVPRPALELKRRFRATLKSSDCNTISEKQRHQLQMMVPVVVLKPIGDRRKKMKLGRRFFKKKASFSHNATSIGPQFSRVKLRDKSFPLDLLLMDPSFEGSLDEEELLDPDNLILRSEEKKCPYCPDQFHNGIGLANHVRGHLNRVGVSYNVRHFISAEEVKAIEQKFSFQKKKKKGMANFDPGTYSLMRCEFCGAGFDTRAGLSSHARAHLRDFGITNWELTISPINILKELLANSPDRRALQALARSEPSSPNQKREPPNYQSKCTTPISEGSIPRSPRSPLAPTWMEEPAQPFRDALVSEEEEIVSMDIDSSSTQKKSPSLGPIPMDKTPSQMSGGMSPDSLGSKQDLQDSKLQTLTTCEVCGASFETRKGLSSHARSHLRQLGVAESESSGAPIDLLYELAKQTKGKPESTPSSPSISKKPSSPPKDGMLSPHPPLQPLHKLPDAPTNRAIKSPPGFSHKSHPETGSPMIKKTHPHLSPSPSPKHMEEKSMKMNMCSIQNSPRSHWGPSEDDGPLNLTVDDDPDSEIDCQLCGAWFETRKGLSSHARAHLRHLGVADPDSKGSPVDLLNDLIMSDDFQSRLLALRPSERKLLAAVGVSEKPNPKNMGTAAAGSMAALSPPGGGGGGMKKIMLAAGGGGMKHYLSPHLRPFGKQQSQFPLHSSPPPKKLKQQMPHPPAQSGMQRKHSLSPGTYWPSSPTEMSPINLSSGAEPVRDIRCEFCGEYFENRKGLSSHARSHLRQMGVTEWYMNGSPIDTMRDLLRRRSLPRPSSNPPGPGPSPSPKPLHKPMASSGSLGSHSTVEIRVPTIPKKMSMSPSSPMARSPHMTPPTARKMFHHMSSPSMQKKPKLEQMKFHFKRDMIPVNVPNEHLSVNRGWESQDDLSPLNLSSRVEPVRDIRCEFCGEYFENRKGLSSHARSHLRQMGVTEWSVNGSPIDTLREILQKKHKPIQIKKESNAGSPEPQPPRPPPLLLPKPLREERSLPNSPGKHLQVMPISPHGGRTGRPVQSHLSMTTMNRDVPLSLVGSKPHGAFLTPLSMKRPLPEERMIQHGDLKPKAYIQTELQFKSKVKSAQEKALAQMTSTEACCELCGLYFENRKALASHARAHLRQFGVTEWCVNGSPIETLTEWIKHRPQKAGAYRSYIQGGRPFTKKFRKAHASDREALVKKLPMTLPSAGAPGTMKTIENDNPHTESSKSAEVGSSSSIIDSPSLGSSSMHVQKEEFISRNINKFERRPARLPETPTPRDEEASDFQTKAEEVRQTPLKVRPVPSLVPRPPQTSLVKFVGNIYTLKCRFCEVEFQGPLSIQEEWVRHLQRHILEMNFSKSVGPLHEEVEVPMTTEVQ